MNKIKHLKVIEYEHKYPQVGIIPMIAMFNASRIDEEEVKKLILSSEAEHNDFIVTMFKSQYENLFDLEDMEFYNDLNMEQKETM